MENELPIKSIPSNLEAERAVLGSLLIDPDAIIKVANFLRTEDFFRERHGWLYDVMLTLHERREPLDFVTVVDELERREQLEEIGGPAYITDLIAGTPTSINVDFYARIVERTALLRRLISAAGQIAELAYDETQEVEEVIDRAETLIFGVSEARIHRDLVPIRAIMGNVVDRIDFLTRNRDTLMGVPTGFTNLDRLLGGLQKSDLVILAARPAMGKCVTADTRLVDPETGALHTIEQLVEQRKAKVLTLNEHYRLQHGQASDFIDDGVKPVYRVTTASGREVKVTLSHPFLTGSGWHPLYELRINDRIAVPRCLPVFGTEEAADANIKVLAYLLADGCMTRRSGAIATNAPNSVRLWLEELGVWDKAAGDKFVPDFAFRLTRPKLALFLNRLFACDGSVYLLKTGQPGLSYSTISKRLAQDVQHLLLRFGVLSNLRTRSVRYQGTHRAAFELRVLDARSIRTFCTEIGAFGKEDRITAVLERLDSSPRHTNLDTVPIEMWDVIGAHKGERSWTSLARALGHGDGANLHVGKRTISRDRLLAVAEALAAPDLADLATGDVYWDRITAIDYLGEQQVYDLTVPDTHNFVADDIFVHNTSLAINVAQNAAKRYNARVAIFSLEMSNEQLAQRLLSMETGIDSHRLRLGQVHEDEWPILLEAANVLAGTNIFIDDTPAASVTEIRTKCRRLYAEHGLDLVLIDYMQLMSGQSGGGRNENRQQEISYISRSLKALARELNVPVIALSQLSRAVESRSDKRPMLSDLRESGSIEQDADVVLFIYRDDYYNEESEQQNIADVIVAKHRHGSTGTVSLYFRKELTQFRDLEIQRTELEY